MRKRGGGGALLIGRGQRWARPSLAVELAAGRSADRGGNRGRRREAGSLWAQAGAEDAPAGELERGPLRETVAGGGEADQREDLDAGS